MVLGVRGGVELIAPNEHDRLLDVARRIADRGLSRVDLNSAVGDYSRVLSMRWSVRIDGQKRLTIPEEVRKLGLLPGHRGHVVVWAFAGVVELWQMESWLELTTRLAARPSLEDDALDLLADLEGE